MKKIFVAILIIMSFCSASTAEQFNGGTVKQKTIKMTTLEYPPYADKSIIGNGDIINKMRVLLAQKGIRLIVEFLPWKRAVIVANDPEYSGYLPCWEEEVQPGFAASKPIVLSNIDVITLKNNEQKFTDIEDLFRTYHVGLVRDYIYPENIQKLAEKYKNNVIYAQSDHGMIKMLNVKDRFDFGISDIKVIQYYDNNKTIKHVKKITTKPLVVAVKVENNDTKLLDLINSLIPDL